MSAPLYSTHKSTGCAASATSIFTINFTAPSGASSLGSPYIWAILGSEHPDDSFSGAAISYGGTSMTEIVSVAKAGGSSSVEIKAFGLANPPAGAQDVIATWTTDVYRAALTIISFTGVDTTTPIQDTGSTVGGWYTSACGANLTTHTPGMTMGYVHSKGSSFNTTANDQTSILQVSAYAAAAYKANGSSMIFNFSTAPSVCKMVCASMVPTTTGGAPAAATHFQSFILGKDLSYNNQNPVMFSERAGVMQPEYQGV